MFRSIFVLSVLVSVGLCSIANIKHCDNVVTACNVTEVRIDPCDNPSRGCRLKKGKIATISFDYIPEFAATSLLTEVTYGIVPFKSLDQNACVSTTCPVEAGKPYTFNYDLMLSKKLPNGNYPVQWKLWDESTKENICCFKTTLILVK